MMLAAAHNANVATSPTLVHSAITQAQTQPAARRCASKAVKSFDDAIAPCGSIVGVAHGEELLLEAGKSGADVRMYFSTPLLANDQTAC
jgi:hypothetical protein